MSDVNRDWTRTASALPLEGTVVETMTLGGAVQDLQIIGRLWFVPDGSMYVYFTPAYWRVAEADRRPGEANTEEKR